MSEINLSFFLRTAAAAMLSSPDLKRIQLDRIRFFIRKTDSPDPRRVSTVIGRHNLPANLHFREFPSKALYLIYFDWPRYFDLEFEEKTGILFANLVMCARSFDGVLPEKFPEWKKLPAFQTWFSQNKEKLVKNEVFTKSSPLLESKYKVTGDVYPVPVAVRI